MVQIVEYAALLYAAGNGGTWGGIWEKPGLHPSCLTFIRENDISVLGWDMLEASPPHFGENVTVHSAISSFGVALLDNALLAIFNGMDSAAEAKSTMLALLAKARAIVLKLCEFMVLDLAAVYVEAELTNNLDTFIGAGDFEGQNYENQINCFENVKGIVQNMDQEGCISVIFAGAASFESIQ